MKILVVCLGNICRSPLGEGILQDMANKQQLNWKVDSAAILSYHVGSAPHPMSQKVAKEKGIDISGQVARLVSQADFAEYDHILAMADDVLEGLREVGGSLFHPHKVRLYLEHLFPGEKQDVPDPWGGPDHEYYTVYDLIEKGAEAIVRDLTLQKTTS